MHFRHNDFNKLGGFVKLRLPFLFNPQSAIKCQIVLQKQDDFRTVKKKEITPVICRKCGESNAPLKKCCQFCGAVLEGRTINNVTGKTGYRNADGSFTPDVTPQGCYFAGCTAGIISYSQDCCFNEPFNPNAWPTKPKKEDTP